MEWGTHDCALFAAGWVCDATGVDHAAFGRGRYRSAVGARRVLSGAGLDGVEALATRALGASLASPSLAQRGDIVSFDTAAGGALGDVALGICVGAQIAGPGPDILVFLPLSAGRLAWRV